jgi:hypothetical protein
VPAESWGTFVGYCVPQLIAVCVLYTEIKISALFKINGVFYHKIKSCALVGTPYTRDLGKRMLSRDNCCLLRNKFLNTGAA